MAKYLNGGLRIYDSSAAPVKPYLRGSRRPGVASAGRFVKFEDSDPVLIMNLPADILDRARTITAFAYPGLPPARIVLLAAEKMARAVKGAGPGSIEGDDGEGATSARTKGTDRQGSSKESQQRARAQQTPLPTITKVQATQSGKPSATSQIKNPASKFWDGVLTRLFKREGGYNPRDPSNRGIKADTLKNFLKRKGRPARSKKELMDKLRKLTENEARQIYREDFIEEAELARIPDRGLAEQVLDGVVNQGRENGIVQLQEALKKVLNVNLKSDGRLGPRTEKAIQEAIKQGRLTELGKQLVKERQDFIDKSPKINAREKPVLKRRAQEVGPK